MTPDFHPSEADDQVFPELAAKQRALREQEREQSAAAFPEEAPRKKGRTRIATETVEIAFMLLCYQRWGATLTPILASWARKTLAQNGELRPDQIEGVS